MRVIYTQFLLLVRRYMASLGGFGETTRCLDTALLNVTNNISQGRQWRKARSSKNINKSTISDNTLQQIINTM